MSWTSKATAPTLGVVSPAPATPPAPTLQGWPRGRDGARGGRDACQLLGKGGQWWQEKQASLSPRPSSVITHCRSLLEEKEGCSMPSVSPPSPAWAPGSCWGAPLLCQWCGAFWNVWGTRGDRACAQGVGWRAEGAHRHQTTRGQERGVVGGRGQGLGGQLAGPGSREGPGQTVMIVFLGLREKEERTMLGPPKRGAVSGPRMAHDAPGSCLPSLSILSPPYLIPCPSHLSPNLLPTTILRRGLPLRADRTKPLSFLPQPPGGAAGDPS